MNKISIGSLCVLIATSSIATRKEEENIELSPASKYLANQNGLKMTLNFNISAMEKELSNLLTPEQLKLKLRIRTSKLLASHYGTKERENEINFVEGQLHYVTMLKKLQNTMIFTCFNLIGQHNRTTNRMIIANDLRGLLQTRGGNDWQLQEAMKTARKVPLIAYVVLKTGKFDFEAFSEMDNASYLRDHLKKCIPEHMWKNRPTLGNYIQDYFAETKQQHQKMIIKRGFAFETLNDLTKLDAQIQSSYDKKEEEEDGEDEAFAFSDESSINMNMIERQVEKLENTEAVFKDLEKQASLIDEIIEFAKRNGRLT